MTTPTVHGPTSDDAMRLEVRWIVPGELDDRIREWFGRFPATTESREDEYLIGSDLGDLSVKIRAGRALELKMYRGPNGVLEVPGRAKGFMEFWQKWSFPLEIPRQADESVSWRPVHKIRRMTFVHLEAGRLSARAGERGTDKGCAVELTEVTMLGRNWWSLGFEAVGPLDGLGGAVEATAAHLFDHVPREDFELTLDESGSYANWLRRSTDGS